MPQVRPPKNTKQSIVQRARSKQSLATIAEQADKALTPNLYNRKLTDEMCEAVLVRVAAGDSVTTVCEALGVGSGLIYQRAYNDPSGFGARLAAAMEISMHTMADRMLTVAQDEDIGVERAKLIISTIQWLAKHRARSHYGDRPLLNADKVTIVLDGSDMSRL